MKRHFDALAVRGDRTDFAFDLPVSGCSVEPRIAR
jgi:hypothetical protein